MKNYFFFRNLLCLWFLTCSLTLSAQYESYRDYKEYLKSVSERYGDSSVEPIQYFSEQIELQFAKKDTSKIAMLLIYLGREYCYKVQDMGKALNYFTESLKLAQKIGDCRIEISAIVHQNLCYFELNQLDIFFKNYNKAANLAEKCPQSDHKIYIHTQLGSNYAYNDSTLLLAEKHFLIADSIATNQLEANYGDKTYLYSNFVYFYKNRKKDPIKARYIAEKAKNLILKDAHYIKTSDLAVYSFIAELFYNAGQKDSAFHYAHILSNLPPQNYTEDNKDYIKEANRLLSDMYRKEKDFDKALLYKEKCVKYLDSLNILHKRSRANDKVQILEDQLLLEKKQLQSEKDKWIQFFLSSLAVLVLIIAGILFYYTQKFRKLNRLLHEQKQELTTLNEIRTKMFSILSHDLLSPISALKSMMDLHQHGVLSQKEFNDSAPRFKRNLEAILTTINSICGWSYTQLNGKKPFIESLNMHKIITNQFELQAHSAIQKNIELINDMPEDFTLLADYNQMSLIARNLIDNAIKYTPSGGKVIVSAKNTEGGKLITFKDTGRGMSADKVKKLFNLSQEDHKSNEKGVSLGLQMVNDLVKANNFTITVDSYENE